MSNVDSKVITIGRASDNTVMLETANVSAHHARLTVSPNRIILEDLKSTNGTSIRTVENKTMRAIVTPGDSIFFGSAEYSVAEILQLAEQSTTPPSQTPVSTVTPEVTHASEFPNATIAVCATAITVAVLWLAFPKGGEAPADTAAATTIESRETAPEAILETAVAGMDESKQERPESGPTSEESQTVSGPTESSPSGNGEDNTAARFDAAEAIFVVFCRESESRTPFRVGTAFVINDGRVVTSASVIYSLRKLMKSSFTDPTLYSPTRKRWIAISQMRVHPKFEEITTQVDALPVTTENQKTMVALLKLRTAFDVGYFDIDEKLQVGLSLRDENLRPGQKLRVIGYPFDVNDPFFDASIPIKVEQLTVRADSLQFSNGVAAASLSARVDDHQTDQTNLAFIGSPILDASDLVIGLYVRPTPENQNIDAFDGSLVSQLAEEFSK
ncbi:FHA domain-containing protein [Fuerstiella marisgermanici]|uniref:FHA domain protein n=1 Tax=Fuerstiella marisgermanici TaxID=1891926 RepID=A0A1P8WNB9_9PLAN|nr:FHA domain-containing protein [Fuerstiella marisgermanici]APZ95550.1 FHA domain protein [Fuerstiella marisgermanici]